MTLQELAEKYQTDKLEHGYTPFYEATLPKSPKKLLEIGVLHGNSIRMWKEYFPETSIHGLDLFIENPIPDIDGITWHKGSQTDPYLLEVLRNEQFDVIISDGSHNCRDEWITFYGLIDSCGIYVLEDAHCADFEGFQQGLKRNHTMLGQMESGMFPFDYKLFLGKIAFIKP